ncbi:hypothetical protein CK203_050827 [Vitis vinifera]|uniref:RNase H type-1 domain-containing protein n=1 Tax=Vitis vinifera TaxID=29760 RepID=A0A438HBJ7_VITVI|nr:hypothetical protein CK203_050827 [Vitis vinifera]
MGSRPNRSQFRRIPFDATVPPPPPHSQPAPQTIPFTLHSQTEVAPPPAIVPTPISEDPHARMDKLEQKLRQMRTSEGAITWEDFDGAPVASLPAKFRMPEIERYTGIGCPRIHLRLYSTVMRAHGLDDAQMVMLFPMSLSGAAQRWFASLEVSRRTWDDLAQEFLRQFAFNTVIDVSRRELEALRQRPEESVTSFISRWREKISQIIDRPSERDQISMIMRSLQPRFARHLMGFPHTDFGSLVQALYGIEEGIARGLWSESSPTDSKGKRPSGGQRSGDVGAISSAGMRPSRRYQTVGQTPGYYYPPSPHAHYRPPAPSRPMTPTYLHPDSQPVFAAHVAERPPAPYTRPRAPQTTTYVQRPPRQFAQLGMPLSRAFQKLTEGGLLIPLASRPLPQPIPPRFRMDLHCSYHQGPGHDTDHCTALRHAIQDLIDQGLVNLGQPSVTTNPLPAHSTHAVHPSSGDIHHMDLIEDDSIHMLSWDDGLPEPIVLHDSYEIDGVSLVPQTPAPFSLIPDEAPFQGREIQIVTRSGRIAQPPPPAVRPFEGTASHEEVRREDDEVLRQLQSTQARISIWSLLASSSTHRDALIRALSQIRVETTTTPEGLIHMMTAGRATCIVFSDDDLPPDGLDHVRPLYITVGCSGRRVPSVLLDNGSALNVCPLATAIALGFAPSDFGPSTQTVRAYDSTKREVMGTLMIDLQIGPATFSTLFQKVKFIHDGQVITVRSTRIYLPLLSRYFRLVTHSSTVVLDMMRGMTFLPGMGLGRRQQGPSEFIAAIDHDTTFGLGFIPTEADYRHMARLRKERTRPRLEEIDSVVHTDRETELQHLFHQLQLSDGAPDSSFPLTITPMSPDRASMLSLCFPEEITSDGVIVDPTELQPVSAFDMFGVSTIEVFKGTQTFLVPELPEDDSSLFEGIVSPHFEYSPVSCDSISTSAPHSPITQIFDIDDEIAHPKDQPRELKIGSPLSTDERDRLIHLLRSYLDVFAWSYEDMPGLDPYIVQHHLPTLPHARPVKQKLRRLHPRWSLQVKEEIQKQLSVGFISVVEYPEWLANVVPVPKKDGKVRAIRCCLSWMGFQGVMPFGLKNAGATYQRAATTLFHDMMHRDVEVYVDDMIVKSRGHIVSERGIEVDPDKIKAILDMLAPRLRKRLENQPIVWNDDCQFAFEKIKEYLLSPPVLVPPTPRRPLLLYLSVSDMALGCMLAQIDDLGKDTSLGYQEIEALHDRVFSAFDIPSRPVKILVDRPALTGRLMRWLVLLTEFDIQYVSQKSIKGNEEFVAMTSLSGWCLYFDGAANQLGYGIGVLLVSPQGDHIPRSVRLAFHDRHPITNNIVEYEACILGLETALELGIRQMEVFGDSNLVLRQIQGDWKTRDVKLKPYHAYLELLVARFDDLRYVHLPRAHNRFADALATLAPPWTFRLM